MKPRPQQRWRVTDIVQPRGGNDGFGISRVEASSRQLSRGGHTLHMRPPRCQWSQSLLSDPPAHATPYRPPQEPGYEQLRCRAKASRTSQGHKHRTENTSAVAAPVRHHGPNQAAAAARAPRCGHNQGRVRIFITAIEVCSTAPAPRASASTVRPCRILDR
jgi:hypothetical protein